MFYVVSCEDNPTRPEVEYGRRDYVWEEDTLDVTVHNRITFRDMVGNSADDIWLGNLHPGLWHYDGEEWAESQFPGVTPSALWLFDDNTLWIGTGESKFIKYENGVWSNEFRLVYEDFDILDIFGIYGRTKDDIFAVGWVNRTIIPGEEYINKPIIMHFNGSAWSFVEIPELFNVGFHKITYQTNIETYFIYATEFKKGVITDKIFTFAGININVIMSSTVGIGLSQINDQVYMNSNQKVYKYENDKLVVWKDFSGTDFWSEFVGRGENDFFNNSAKGLGHYNGVDYKTIYPTNLDLQSRIIFGKDLFVTAQDTYNGYYIIIHGTLIE